MVGIDDASDLMPLASTRKNLIGFENYPYDVRRRYGYVRMAIRQEPSHDAAQPGATDRSA